MLMSRICKMFTGVKKQLSQDVLHGDAAEEELSLAHLVSSYTLPHQNSQPGKSGRQTARSKVLSRRTRDMWSVKGFTPLCLTWAALVGDGLVATLLWIPPEVWANEVREREIERVGMNLVVIEEHQVGDLVFAQLYYLYILLRPHQPMLSYQ